MESIETLSLSVSLKLKSIPVKVIDVDGNEKTFTLRELNGEQRDNYLDNMNKRMTYKGGEVDTVKDLKGIHTSLLCQCLYNDADQLLTEPVLKLWPARVLKQLYNAAQELSGLGEKEDEKEDEAKNSQKESDSAGSS